MADLGRVNRNIEKMIAQNAPEQDIDAYVASEGMTPDELRQRNLAVKKQGAGANVMQGMTFGFGDEIAAGGVAGLRSVYDPRTGEFFSGDIGKKYDQELGENRQILEDARATHPLASTGLEMAGGLATAGGLAKSGLSMGANAIRAGKPLSRVALASGAEGAGYGGAYGFGGGEGGLENRAEGAGYGALAGGLAGAAVPAATASVGRLISPFKSPSERAAMADVLKREGVDVTAGQRTGSNALRYAESELGGNKAANMMERQGEQFTAAALRRGGSTANRATPDVIDDAYNQIGQQFDALAARNQLMPDVPLFNDLTAVVSDYNSLVPASQRAPVVNKVIGDLLKTFGTAGPNGTPALQGASYQALRSSLDRAARATKDPQLAQALRGIKNAVDDGMERSIAQANPRDLGAWRDVRNKYRNMLVIEQAATGAGEHTAQGLISPSHLRQATLTKHGRRNYARGKSDFAELARAGEAVMKPLPQSGTAPRLMARTLGTMGAPALIGGGYGYGQNGFEGAAAGAVAGAALPKLVGALMMSKAGQKYLGNQAAQNVSTGLKAIVNALMVNQGSIGAARAAAP